MMASSQDEGISLVSGDALVIVDMQKDFLPGGSLAVPRGDEVIGPLNGYIDVFLTKGLPIVATRDWHPEKHCSFKAQGGPWPPHCVQSSQGAEFAPGLRIPQGALVISKGTELEKDAYSGFQGTDLDERLKAMKVERLFIGGLATDYCVLNTAKDALSRGYKVLLLQDAIRAVDVQPGDGGRAVNEMIRLGAVPITLDMLRS